MLTVLSAPIRGERCWTTERGMMFSDTITRFIRTYIPIGVGVLVANLPFLADIINSDALVALAIASYYALASALEKVHPAFGWLLGVPKVTATTTATGKSVPESAQKV